MIFSLRRRLVEIIGFVFSFCRSSCSSLSPSQSTIPLTICSSRRWPSSPISFSEARVMVPPRARSDRPLRVGVDREACRLGVASIDFCRTTVSWTRWRSTWVRLTVIRSNLNFRVLQKVFSHWFRKSFRTSSRGFTFVNAKWSSSPSQRRSRSASPRSRFYRLLSNEGFLDTMTKYLRTSY